MYLDSTRKPEIPDEPHTKPGRTGKTPDRVHDRTLDAGAKWQCYLLYHHHSVHNTLLLLYTMCLCDTLFLLGVVFNVEGDRVRTCVCADMSKKGHGVAALAHLATVFTHVSRVLLSFTVDLLRVLHYILIHLVQ